MEIVDLSIKGDPQSPIFVGHRLTTTFSQVDDGKAAVAESGLSIGPEPIGVGPSVSHHITHATHQIRMGLDGSGGRGCYGSGNSTHGIIESRP